MTKETPMPRRNRREQRRWREPERTETPPTLEQLARRLVQAGKCSAAILDHGVTRGEGVPRETRTAVDPPLDKNLSLNRDVTPGSAASRGERRG